jgi:hypothetical protein
MGQFCERQDRDPGEWVILGGENGSIFLGVEVYRPLRPSLRHFCKAMNMKNWGMAANGLSGMAICRKEK